MQDTNLALQIAPLKATFQGTPQEMVEQIVRRAKIVSPTGTNFIYIGDAEPTSDVGPWLKLNKQWWVFDTDINRYVPLDISESETQWFHMQNSTPTTSTPPVWLKTTRDQTEDDTSHGDPIGWYTFNGTVWVPYVSIVLSGATTNRPSSPVEFQQFYDSDISCLIWWERGQWRTVSGVPGDLKQVGFQVLSEALRANPGWSVFGENNQTFRGRFLSQATKDSGASPETVLTTGTSVAARAAFETFGETDGVKIDGTSPVPYPPTIALWTLIKN